MNDESACGGTYKVTVENGVYEIRCEKCGAVTAAGPGSDRHFFEQFYATQRCQAPRGSS